MTGKGIRSTGTALALLGLVGMLLVYWLSFFWVSTDRLQGVSQRIFYFHVPLAWTGLGNYAGKGLPLTIPQKRSGQCESPSLGTTPDLN